MSKSPVTDADYVDLGKWMCRNPLFRMYSASYSDGYPAVRFYVPGGPKGHEQPCIVSLRSGAKPCNRKTLAVVLLYHHRTTT
jgi:hypothetical protein